MSSIVEPTATTAVPVVPSGEVLEEKITEMLSDPSADKIAEAEELAAEALRMANEAKRAAERLAEVKATLSRFSKKLDKAEMSIEKKTPEAVNIVVVEDKHTSVVTTAEDEATPFETDKADAIASKVEEKKEEVDEKKEEQHEEEEEEAPVPPPSPKKKVTLVPPKPETISHIVVIQDSDDKDVIESLLDQIGLDKACGVDDVTVMKALAKSQNIHITPTVAPKPEPEAPPTVIKKERPASNPPPVIKTVYNLPKESLPLEDEIVKDPVELFFDYTVGRACGVDDVTLGLALPYIPPDADDEPAPFVNPTKVTDIKKSKSMEEELAKAEPKADPTTQKKTAAHSKYPPKVYQTTATNSDFADPFGIDHDSFVMCGAIADSCEPDFSMLEQPSYVATIEGDRMVASVDKPLADESSDDESGVVVETEEEKEEEVAGVTKETEEDKGTTVQCEPEGEKTNDDDLYAADDEAEEEVAVEEPKPVVKEEATPVTFEEEKKESEEDAEIMALNDLQRRELERRIREQEELLRQVDDHIWCV